MGAPGAPLVGGIVLVVICGLDAGDVGGQEVDAVAVEVAPGSVVVLGGSRVGVTDQDLGVAKGDAGVKGVGDRRVPQECGLMCRGMVGVFAIRAIIL